MTLTVPPYPLVPTGSPVKVVGAEGTDLLLADGGRVLDAGGGAIVANVGWGRAEVADAVAEALRRHTYSIPPWTSPERERLAERLVERWLPEGLDHVLFVSGGSESVDAAIRLALHHHAAAGRPERHRILGRDDSYHGVTLSALDVGGHRARRARYEHVLSDTPKAPSTATGRLDPHARTTAADLEAVLVEVGPETVAALIVEPVTGSAAGAVLPAEGELTELRALCDRHGILLIVDEVMSGFGRTGRNFGVDHEGVRPDICVAGKGLAGGYAAMGGVYATDEVIAPLAAVGEPLMFFTFAGHPAGCAAADAVLRIMEDEALVDRSARLGTHLLDALHEALDDHPRVVDVRGRGLWAGVELDGGDRAGHFANAVVAEGLRRGVFYYPSGGGGTVADAVMFGPAFTITEAELDRAVEVLAASISAV